MFPRLSPPLSLLFRLCCLPLSIFPSSSFLSLLIWLFLVTLYLCCVVIRCLLRQPRQIKAAAISYIRISQLRCVVLYVYMYACQGISLGCVCRHCIRANCVFACSKCNCVHMCIPFLSQMSIHKCVFHLFLTRLWMSRASLHGWKEKQIKSCRYLQSPHCLLRYHRQVFAVRFTPRCSSIHLVWYAPCCCSINLILEEMAQLGYSYLPYNCLDT